MKILSKLSQLAILCVFLCSCGQREGLAPVVESNWLEVNSHTKQHIVKRGDTLYSIAFRYDQDYRQLAIINHLSPPYTVRIGQIIRLNTTDYLLKPYDKITSAEKSRHAQPPPRAPIVKSSAPLEKSYSSSHWIWPINGRIVAYYSPFQGKKGIDIAGKRGEKIRAANDGVVAYAGNGLSGYGNLIIIKHDHQYLTAYGNNSRNLVKEGQHIKKGQAIAEIGVVDRHYWGVHFEIRRAGKPINPLNYLQKG